MGRQMSHISRFMATARTILDEKDRAVAPKAQPPFFVRTTWLFAELAEMAHPDEAATFKAITVARLGGDIEAIARAVDQIRVTTEAMPGGRQRHERKQIVSWINDQIAREWQR